MIEMVGMVRIHTRRQALKTGLSVLTLITGCTSSTNTGQPDETRTDMSPKNSDCSDATISSTKIIPLTSGDTLVVEGQVFHTPAPNLRGFIIPRCGEDDREEIEKSLDSVGDFKYNFKYNHHGIRDYAFWLEGCESPTPKPQLSPEGCDK